MKNVSVQDNLNLSILDFAYVYHGNTPTETLKKSTEVVKLADELGYTRYWFTEHHNTEHIVSTSPDLLALHAAGNTKNIRVGTGGIMLPNYSSLKVAENFTLLEALHPGRVDLGLGRASGTDGPTALALHRSREVMLTSDFSEQLEELLGFFSRDFPNNHPYSSIKIAGDSSLTPDIFMLGSSFGAVKFAIQKGLGYVFAAHLSPELAVPVLRSYREKFVPSKYLKEPKSVLSIPVITAETEEEAKYLAGPMELLWARMGSGSSNLAVVSPEEAANHKYTNREIDAYNNNKPRFIIGSIKQVGQKLRDLAKESLADEIMIVDFYGEQEGRLKAYNLLAEEFLKTNTK